MQVGCYVEVGCGASFSCVWNAFIELATYLDKVSPWKWLPKSIDVVRRGQCVDD